jgi:hypothetical protein
MVLGHPGASLHTLPSPPSHKQKQEHRRYGKRRSGREGLLNVLVSKIPPAYEIQKSSP